MGNARSKSASRARPNEKVRFLFEINNHNYPSNPTNTSKMIKIKKEPETFTSLHQIENISQNMKKSNKLLHEINESIKLGSIICEYNLLTNPNFFFLQFSSLLYNPQNLSNKKENKYYLDFPSVFDKSVNNQILIKTPKTNKSHRENSVLEKSNGELSSDIKKVHSPNAPGSFVKEGTPKLHNTRDLSSPKEDGSTPHFDKKSDFSQNSQTKNEINQTADGGERPLKEFAVKIEESNTNGKENPTSLKEKLNHILKANIQPLNKSMNSDNSLKISGILDAIDDEPHYIHLNLEDFLKSDNEKNTSAHNILSKANLEKLNSLNSRPANEKRLIQKNNTIRRPKLNSNHSKVESTNKNLKINNIIHNNSKPPYLKSFKNEENEVPLNRNKFFQNSSNSLLKMLNENNNSKTMKIKDKENENNHNNSKKYASLSKEKKNNANVDNTSKIRKKN